MAGNSRVLGDERGYRVVNSVVVVVRLIGVRWNLNPHPLKAEGAAPKKWSRRSILRTSGAAGCAQH